jgi:hypothetical protein
MTNTARIAEVAAKAGITPADVAAIFAFEATAPALPEIRAVAGGTVEVRPLHTADAIAVRRAELAAERAANPVDPASIQAMLRRL